jgi:hypothetical protein
MFATQPGFVDVVRFEPPEFLDCRSQARAVEQMARSVPVSAGAVVPQGEVDHRPQH